MTATTPAEPQATAGKRSVLNRLMMPLAIFAALAALFAFALSGGDPSKLPSALIGRPVPLTEFPPLEGLLHNGQPVAGFSAADLAKGQVSVVNFWASWCVPCIEEHPLLITLKERTGVALYGVNYKDQAEAGRRFLGRYGNPFSVVGVDGNGRGSIEWGVYGVPETFVVGRDGTIVYKLVGPVTPANLDSVLKVAIEKALRTGG